MGILWREKTQFRERERKKNKERENKNRVCFFSS